MCVCVCVCVCLVWSDNIYKLNSHVRVIYYFGYVLTNLLVSSTVIIAHEIVTIVYDVQDSYQFAMQHIYIPILFLELTDVVMFIF